MKFKNKLETGRSMVEIIGVLAVVGVLSVGGIMGYSYGMDRHKANETVKGLTLRALDIQSQVDKCSGEICDVSIDGWEDDTPYTITMDDDGLLQINGVPSRVCKIIGDLLMDSAAVYVEGIRYDPKSTTDPCDTRDNHALFFDFDPVVLADKDDVGQQPDTEKSETEIVYASHPGNEEEEETSISGDILESTENPEIIVCPSVEPGATYCNQEAPIWVDPNDVCDSTRQCLNREMQGDYSVKLCNYEDVSYDTNWRCPTNDIVYSSDDDGIISTEIEEDTTLFPVKPDTETTLFPVKPDESTSSVESEEITVVVISKPIDLIARLKSENPSCPDPYYDSVTQTVYYYAEWDPWDKCAVRTCTWDTYANDWMCQV